MSPKNQIIITAGSVYVNIDILASSFTLQELFQVQGVNASIEHVRHLNATISTNLAMRLVESLIQKHPHLIQEDASFIFGDGSDLHDVEKFVN